MTAPRSEARRLYVVEQRGRFASSTAESSAAASSSTLRDSVVVRGEQGLLGLAFDPKYATNRFIYVNYTDEAGDTQVVRYRTNGSRAIPGSALVLLSIDQPYANHNGGEVAFGPDGCLYVGTGDGGSGGDPENRAQNMQSAARKDAAPRRRAGRGSAPEIVGPRPAEPLALLVRPAHRRPLHRRRRPGRRSRRSTTRRVERRARELRLGRLRGVAALRGQGSLVREARVPRLRVQPPAAAARSWAASCLSREGAAVRTRPVHLSATTARDVVVEPAHDAGARPSDVRTEPFKIPSLSSFGEDAAGELYATSLERASSLTGSASAAANARGGACPSAAYASAFSDSCRSCSSRAIEGEALLTLGRAVQALELAGDPVEPLEQGVELAISDVAAAPRTGILRTAQEVVRAFDDDRGIGSERQPGVRASAPAPDSSVDDAPRRAELREGDARERSGRVGEHAELDAARTRAPAARRSSPRRDAGRRERDPRRSARAACASSRRRAIERRGGLAAIRGERRPGRPRGRPAPSRARPATAARVSPSASRSIASGACGRHARRRARADCQSAIPIATPTASIATSIGDPCRPGTNVWWTSSLAAYSTPSPNASPGRAGRADEERAEDRVLGRVRELAEHEVPAAEPGRRGRERTRTRRSRPPRRGRGARHGRMSRRTVR